MFCKTKTAFKSRLSLIVRVYVVLNRTVVVDSDSTETKTTFSLFAVAQLQASLGATDWRFR